jgi:hypothetical protein
LALSPFQDALTILSYLEGIKSSRVDEFRIACQAKFPVSTVFKSAEDQAVLREQCILEEPNNDDEVEDFESL